MQTRRSARRLPILIAALLLPLTAFGQSVVGDWNGSFKAVDGTKLLLVLHIKATPNGTLAATLDSIGQDSPNIPVDSITFDSKSLKLNIPQADAAYEGQINREGTEIKGFWTEGKALALTFKRATDATRISAPKPLGSDWQGIIQFAAGPSTVTLHLHTEHYSKITASISGIPGTPGDAEANQLTFAGDKLSFSIKLIHASFAGSVTQDGSGIVGVWKQGQAYPLDLHRVAASKEPGTVPDAALPAEPDPTLALPQIPHAHPPP